MGCSASPTPTPTRYLQAGAAFAEALEIDPFLLEPREGLETATQLNLARILSGEEREALLLEPPPPVQASPPTSPPWDPSAHLDPPSRSPRETHVGHRRKL